MTPQFNAQNHETWRQLFAKQAPLREQQLAAEFSRGLKILEIDGTQIPDLAHVNKKLKQATGWRGEYVKGLVSAEIFFKMLSERRFPVGNFIREPGDASYTPAPDVFHDLYGHLPFYTNPDYANFNEQFGVTALRYINSPEILEEFQRFFWFGVEFALVKTPQGVRIFGAGIASSHAECAYALSNKPRVQKFDLEVIRNKDYRIDIMQDDLFLLENTDQLYSSLNEFSQPYQEKAEHAVSS